MRKRVQVELAFLLVATAGVIVWQGLREREPVYQGKPLSVWLQRYNTHGSFIGLRPEPKADEAVRQIGTNAIPTLLHMLSAHDSKLKLALMRSSGKYHFMGIPVVPAFFPTRQAAAAFHALGANASNAVPRLIQTYREKIGSDSQCGCAEALGWIGPAASEAIPDLVSAATNSDNTLRWVAVAALAHLHAEPEFVLPVLVAALRDPDPVVRKHAVWTLEGLGAAAELAVPALTQSLVDSNFFMSTDVSNALKAIDPAAAAKPGVK